MMKMNMRGMSGSLILSKFATLRDDTLEFSAVIEEIQTFPEPIFDAIVNEDEWQKMDSKW